MQQQIEFEASILGNDGTLAELNSPTHAIERGIIGEAQEALEAVRDGMMEHAKEEAADVLIFLCTFFNHLGMSYEEVCELSQKKMEKNRIKYYSDGEDLPVREIMRRRKEEWDSIVIYESEDLVS